MARKKEGDNFWFEDADRSTMAHQEMTLLFKDLVILEKAISMVCSPKFSVCDISSRIEIHVKDERKFKEGYVDVIIDFMATTICGTPWNPKRILVELKSYLMNWASALRQVKGYKSSLVVEESYEKMKANFTMLVYKDIDPSINITVLKEAFMDERIHLISLDEIEKKNIKYNPLSIDKCLEIAISKCDAHIKAGIKEYKLEANNSLTLVFCRETARSMHGYSISDQDIAKEVNCRMKEECGAGIRDIIVNEPKKTEITTPSLNNTELWDVWPRVLQAIKNEKMPLYAVLIDTKPRMIGQEKVVIEVKKGMIFHREQVEHNRALIANIISQFYHRTIKLEVIMGNNSGSYRVDYEEDHKKAVRSAMSIFGGKVA